MLDMLQSKALELKAQAADIHFARFGRWLPAAALLVIAGCSWFDEEPTPPESSAQAGTPAPGEGETMNGEQAQVPDINSVPNEAPKPSIVNLDQAQEGLASDSGNSQYSDTLTMPTQSAARPEKPVEEGAPQAAQADVQPQAPEQPESTATTTTPPVVETPVVETPTPAPTTQVALAGTPQPGAKPFEPSGPLNLAPGSLSRDGSPASTTTGNATTGIAAAPLPGSSTAPMTAPMSAPSGDGVSVDYSVLNGLQASAPTTYQQPPMGGVAPVRGAAPSGSIAGVGQAVGYVYFGNGSSRLSAADRQVLQQVAQLQQVQGGVLRIIGHASARTGNMEALEQQQVNHEMSMQRAAAVARALVEYGVQPILVQVAAAGDDQTLYAESTPAGEAGNRRAEVYLSQN